MNATGMLTDQHQERIIAFKVVCQCDDRTAHYYLLTNNWSMRRATDQYYDDGCRPKNAADLNELLKQRHTLDGHPTPAKKAQEQAVIFKPAPFGSHMQVAISQLFATKELSDVVLVLPGSRTPAHKIVLASGSPVLAAALYSQGEAGAKELVLDEADEAAFHTILAYLYTGKATVASDRVHNLLIAAHRYGVDPLKEKCGVYLFQRHLESARQRKKMAAASKKREEKDRVDNVDDDSEDMQVDDADEEAQEGEEAQGVGHLLALAQTYKCHELEKLCAEDLARNFSTLCESGKLNTLPLSTFIELIKSEKVAAVEEEIFDAVVAYAKFQRDTQGLDEAALLEQLLLFVRFPFIQSQRLVEDVEGKPLIAGLKLTSELLFEAYRYNFYSQLYNQSIVSPKSHADGEESLYADFATKSSTAKGPKFVFTSPLPHYELRCSPRSGAVKWNATKKSPAIAISNNMLTASHSGSSSVWMSVVADIPFSDHCTSIYVHIDRNASNWIFIGVAEEQWTGYGASSSTYLGVDLGTWSHGSAGGYGKVHNGVAATYGVSFATGDTVGVHLNPETGVLSFSCNGKNYGPAYLSLPVNKRLFLAVSLYHHTDQVTLIRSRPKKFKATLNNRIPLAEEEDDPNGFGLFD